MALGLSLRLALSSTTRISIAPPVSLYDYYVDSVGGSDSNDGQSEEKAFKTISKIPLANDLKIALKRGSYFRESLDSSAFSRVTITAYGSGTLPILDAADPFNGTWTASGTANVWMATFTTEDNANGLYPSLWVNGERPKWVDGPSQVVAGTYHSAVPNTDTNTLTYYIYSETDPNESGDLYEMASRHYGFAISNNSYAHFIRTMRQLHNNGSAVIGGGSAAYDCIFEDGVKHNVYVGRNSSINNCIMYRSDWPIRDNFSFHVGHAIDGSGATTSVYNCVAIGELEKIEWANNNDRAIGGFQFHASGEPGQNWDSVLVQGGATRFCNVGVSTVDVNVASLDKHWVDGCYVPLNIQGGTGNLTDVKVTENTIRMRRGAVVNTTNSTFVTRMRVAFLLATGDAFFYDYSQSGALIVRESALYKGPSAGGYTYWFRLLNEGRQLQSVNNVIYSDQSQGGEVCVISTPITAERIYLANTYFGGSAAVDFEIGGRNFFSYEAAATDPDNAGLFDTSVQGTPLGITDPINGNFTTAVDSQAETMEAGIGLQDNVIYDLIPTYAELDLR